MSQQTQCPNCGGFKTEISQFHYDPVRRKRTPKPLTLIGLSIFFVYWAVVFLLLGLYYVFAMMPLGILSLALGASILWFGLGWVRRNRENVEVKYEHTCKLCGYHWVTKPGDPPIPATVRPDLIEKGAQKIAQEEELARRRAADAWMMEQHRKNKRK